MIRRSYGRWCAYKDYRRVYAVLDNVRNLRNCTRVLEAYARFVLANTIKGCCRCCDGCLSDCFGMR
jgi:hypothetical protein